jgi:hypothetical protein
MVNERTKELERNASSQSGSQDELPVQPSSFPSPSEQAPNPSSVPTAEPIPPADPSAASPLPDTRRKRGKSDWWPIALLIVVLAGIGVIATASNDPARNLGGSATPTKAAAP